MDRKNYKIESEHHKIASVKNAKGYTFYLDDCIFEIRIKKKWIDSVYYSNSSKGVNNRKLITGNGAIQILLN
jgi:hypothetical protein